VIEAKRVLESGALGRLYGANTTNQGKLPRYHSAYPRDWFEQKALAGGRGDGPHCPSGGSAALVSSAAK